MNIGDLVIYHKSHVPPEQEKIMAIIIDKKKNEVLWEFGLSWSYTVHCADGRTYKDVSRRRLTKIEEVC